MGDIYGMTGTDTINVSLSNHDPVPNITHPADGTKLTGTETIEETDTGFDNGVDIVYNLFEYYYDENCNGLADDAGSSWTKIGNDTNGADGWSADWNTALLNDCCYLIRATMGDKHGRTGTDEIQVALSNHDPVTSITNPADGSIIGGVVTIVTGADTGFDAGADIAYTRFEHYYDANCNCVQDDGSTLVEIGNDTNGADGWSVNWNTAGLTECYMIFAKMTDKHGRTGVSEINVEIDTTPPTVTDEQATPNVIPNDTDDNPLWGETTNLTATVTDVSGVASVRIDLSQIGGSATQAMTNIGGNLWSVETNASAGTAPANYVLVMTVTDTYGNSRTNNINLRVQKNGDVQPYDGNGVVDFMGDAIYLVRHTRNVPGYENIRDNIADVTGDGVVDFMGDAIYLVRHTRNVGGYEILK